MTTILDPEQLGPEARVLFLRIQKRMRAEETWQDQFALGLAPTASQCGAYLRDARAIAALKESVAPETMRKLEAQLRVTHRLARQGLKLFMVLPPPETNAQGEDAEIAKLCAPLPKLAAPLDSEPA